MSQLPPPPPSGNGRGSGDRRPNPGEGPGNDRGPYGSKPKSSGIPKWAIWVFLGLLAGRLLIPTLLSQERRRGPSPTPSSASPVEQGEVKSITVNNDTGGITGELTNGTKFNTTGPIPLPDADLELLDEKNVDVEFKTPRASFLASLHPVLLLPVGLIIGFFVWMQRRAAGQMGNIMSIGRSRAKTYSTERAGARPSPTSPATRASSRRSARSSTS